MADPVNFSQLTFRLRRIFSLPISRSTLREIQNAILLEANKDQAISDALFQALLTATPGENKKLGLKEKLVLELIDKFSPQTQTARDVFERGDFLALATSDVITQNNRVGFVNRIKRIDGEELQFISDMTNTIHLLHHYAIRLQEGKKRVGGNDKIQQFRGELETVKLVIDDLLKT